MKCADPDCPMPAELPLSKLVSLAECLTAHGWADGGVALFTALNARSADRQEAFVECLFAFMQEHVLPQLEQLEPGFKAAIAAEIVRAFGADHAIAAEVARRLQGH